MSLAYNTLKGSDVTVTPIKLKYSNVIPSGSLTDSGITLTVANNSSFDYYNPSFTDDFLLYRSIQGLYYMNFISGSTSGSAYEWSPQSTAASGTLDNDYRYFPTASNAQILVISIPRAKFGENIARASFSISSETYNIVDDGNGNLVDAMASNAHVGNILYNQGIGIITNYDYINVFFPTPVVPPAPPITDGLRLSLFSDYGVELKSGSLTEVKNWNDLSGYGNDLLTINTGSTFTDSEFGTKPGLIFPTTDSDYFMQTEGAFSGLDGESACTIFIVAKVPGYPTGEGNLISYSGTTGDYNNEGSLVINVSGSMPTISLNPYMSGSGGVNTGVLSTDDSKHIYMFDFDFSKNTLTELIGYKDNTTIDWTFTTPGVENTNTFQNGKFALGYKTNGVSVGCVLVYNRGLNNSERTQVYNYLSSYFTTP